MNRQYIAAVCSFQCQAHATDLTVALIIVVLAIILNLLFQLERIRIMAY